MPVQEREREQTVQLETHKSFTSAYSMAMEVRNAVTISARSYTSILKTLPLSSSCSLASSGKDISEQKRRRAPMRVALMKSSVGKKHSTQLKLQNKANQEMADQKAQGNNSSHIQGTPL